MYGDVKTNDLTNAPVRFYNVAIPFESADARVAANAVWATCMSARGFTYNTQGEAQTALKLSYASEGANPAVDREEIATAVADGECIRESGLMEVKRLGAEAYIGQLDPAERGGDRRAHRDARAHRRWRTGGAAARSDPALGLDSGTDG